MQTLEEKVEREKIEKKLPKLFTSNRHFKYWKSLCLRNSKDIPKIISTEEYIRSGAARKIHITYSTFDKFIKYGLLQINSAKYPRNKVINNNSLVKCICWMYNTAPKNVLFRRNQPIQESQNWQIEKYIGDLCNAHTGTIWFTKFVNQQQKIAQNTKLPKIREWQIIPRYALTDLFCIDEREIMVLSEKQLILPKDLSFKFKKSSSYNILHNAALAHLIANIHQVPFSEIYMPTSEDCFFTNFVDRFIDQKVIPYMLKQEIFPYFTYPIRKSSQKTGISEEKIRKAFQRGYLQGESSAKNRLEVCGIDLALFAAREPWKRHMSGEEVAVLFHAPLKEVYMLSLHSSPEGGYSSQNAIAEFYAQLMQEVRMRFIRYSHLHVQRESKIAQYYTKALDYYGLNDCSEFSKVLS